MCGAVVLDTRCKARFWRCTQSHTLLCAFHYVSTMYSLKNAAMMYLTMRSSIALQFCACFLLRIISWSFGSHVRSLSCHLESFRVFCQGPEGRFCCVLCALTHSEGIMTCAFVCCVVYTPAGSFHALVFVVMSTLRQAVFHALLCRFDGCPTRWCMPSCKMSHLLC